MSTITTYITPSWNDALGDAIKQGYTSAQQLPQSQVTAPPAPAASGGAGVTSPGTTTGGTTAGGQGLSTAISGASTGLNFLQNSNSTKLSKDLSAQQLAAQTQTSNQQLALQQQQMAQAAKQASDQLAFQQQQLAYQKSVQGAQGVQQTGNGNYVSQSGSTYSGSGGVSNGGVNIPPVNNAFLPNNPLTAQINAVDTAQNNVNVLQTQVNSYSQQMQQYMADPVYRSTITDPNFLANTAAKQQLAQSQLTQAQYYNDQVQASLPPDFSSQVDKYVATENTAIQNDTFDLAGNVTNKPFTVGGPTVAQTAQIDPAIQAAQLQKDKNLIDISKGLQADKARADAQLATDTANSSVGKFATGAAVTVGAGAGFFESILPMINAGKASVGGVIGALGSLGGLVVGFHMLAGVFTAAISAAAEGGTGIMASMSALPGLHMLMAFIAANPLIAAAIAAAIIIAIAFLMRTPDDQEQQLIDLSTQMSVWDTSVKPLILSAAAASALISMGYSIDKPLSSLTAAGVSVPTITLNQTFSGALSNADGSAYSGTTLPYNTPIVEKGAAVGGGDRVLIITQGGAQNGKAMDNVQTYDLANNMAFTKPATSTGLYIPFFVNGQKNPQALNMVATQTTLLNSVSALSGSSALTAAQVAAAANKQDITVVPVH